MATVNGKGLLGATIRMPRIGAWRADIEIDPDGIPSGVVEIEIDGVTFAGTALPGHFGVNGTRAVARVVGGSGGLSRQVSARSYESPSGVRISAILGDLCRETGEALSATADQATLDRRLPRWHRGEGLASHALVDLADRAGFDWRILADGTLWVGAATWPEATVGHVLEDEDWTNCTTTIAPTAPSLVPGVTFLGQQVEQVEHIVDREGSLRTLVRTRTLRTALHEALGRIRKGIDFSRLYRCRVSKQNADGTVQLVPDDEVMKGRGLDKVPVRLGLPGVTVRVLGGARCMLGFTGGDPSDPYACNFDQDGNESLVTVDFAGMQAGLARIGDSVMIFLPPAMAVEGTLDGLPFFGALTITTPGFGVIETGNSKFRG